VDKFVLMFMCNCMFVLCVLLVNNKLPGQLSFANDHKGHGVPSEGPTAVPGRHSNVDWQKPQDPEFAQGEQRPIATLFIFFLKKS